LAANVAIGRLLLPKTVYETPLSSLQELRSLQAPVDWIVLGDSTASRSVRPGFLCPRLGVTCLDLSTAGNFSLVEEAWLLELYLRRFPPPKKVVLAHSFPSFSIEARPELLENALAVGWNDAADLRPRGFARFSPAWWRWLGGRVAPCRFMRDEIAESLFRKPLDTGVPPTPHWRRPDLEPVSAGNREALSTIAELARAGGFSVDFVDSPASDLTLRVPGDVALRRAVQGYLHDFSRRHRGFTFIPGLPASYPPSMMRFGTALTHTGPEASKRFSAKLLEYYRVQR
jgi:hypothetical protein